jgi:hypothetical protein
MRKIQIVVLGLFVVFAFGAFAATSFAEESKILWNNEEILALLPFEVSGELLLEDMGLAGSTILCSGIFDGMIEPGGTLGYVEDLLTLAGVLLEDATTKNDLIVCEPDTGSGCMNEQANGLPDVEVNLSATTAWHIEVRLDEPLAGEGLLAFLIDFLNLEDIELSGELTVEELGVLNIVEPIYTTTCNTILGVLTDICHGLSSARLYMDAVAQLRASFNSLEVMEPWGAESEGTNCSIGGAAQGLLVSVITPAGESELEDVELAGGAITDPEGGSFSLSP